MKTCWQVLGIEATTDTDAIRQAYLALLPSFHRKPIRRVLSNCERPMRMHCRGQHRPPLRWLKRIPIPRG